MSRGSSRQQKLALAEAAPARQRLDVWLWFARVVKTRALAVRLAESGHVRINGLRAREAAKAVKIGDVLTIALERELRVFRVLGFDEKRGAYERARLLYEDIGENRDFGENSGDDNRTGPVFVARGDQRR